MSKFIILKLQKRTIHAWIYWSGSTRLNKRIDNNEMNIASMQKIILLDQVVDEIDSGCFTE